MRQRILEHHWWYGESSWAKAGNGEQGLAAMLDSAPEDQGLRDGEICWTVIRHTAAGPAKMDITYQRLPSRGSGTCNKV